MTGQEESRPFTRASIGVPSTSVPHQDRSLMLAIRLIWMEPVMLLQFVNSYQILLIDDWKLLLLDFVTRFQTIKQADKFQAVN